VSEEGIERSKKRRIGTSDEDPPERENWSSVSSANCNLDLILFLFLLHSSSTLPQHNFIHN